ncbi:MAG: hypothetical protein J2P31_10265, partial [Blastocatellia bacterium]|nr:hypothetical protein [Blastocatellia bacterium]
MNVTKLTPLVLPYLIRYLPAIGDRSFEHTSDEELNIAQSWIGNLLRKIEASPTALYAAQRFASSPEDPSNQTALEVELKGIFAADRQFADEIERIFEHADAAHRDNAPGNITIIGGVTQTGEGNQIG